MRITLRRTSLLTLLVAFLVTGLLPAAGSWSCPDGTACVYTPERGFHCQGDTCKLSCCAQETPAHGCGRCDHGAAPALAAGSTSYERTVSGTPHCRYQEAPQMAPAWAPGPLALDFGGQTVALLPTPVTSAVPTSLVLPQAPIRGSPPTTYASAPSSPRAPPGADCA